ncbi:MAG: 3-phosphoshikimate 1-carboxyvinyltransferase [Solirubrobacterales bacterium]|nr:3-phosphoshikimate 1-carboxyvinyltransferase [Solirubrobacterales bacterium]
MSAFVAPAERLRGTVQPPPDKSISHRAALLGTISVEPVTIRRYLDASDTASTLAAMRQLGALVEEHPDYVVVRGTGLREAAPVDVPVDLGEAGTLLRILPGWLAAQEGRAYVLDGGPGLRQRAVDRILAPLRAMGAEIELGDGGRAPLTVRGHRLHAAEHHLEAASAQVKGCLLMAGLCAGGTTVIHEPVATRDHTERLLRTAGVRVERTGSTVRVTNQDELVLDPISVPGDPSAAAYAVAAGLLVRGSRLCVTDTSVNWTRTTFLRIAERMGAIVLADLEEPSDVVIAAEPVSDLDVTAGPLLATEIRPEEVAPAIDELPLLALLGCFAEGTTVLRGAEALRRRPGDRIERVVDGLRGLGATIEATADGFAVTGTDGLRGGRLDAQGDPRLAMLGAVAGMASREGVEVVGMDEGATRYPRFLEHLLTLG